MASDNMKMKIVIDGDNRGFKKSLDQTSRDMKQFEAKQGGGGRGAGLGAMEVLGGGTALGAAAVGARRGALRGLANVTGAAGGKSVAGWPYMLQQMAGSLMGNPEAKGYAEESRADRRRAKELGLKERLKNAGPGAMLNSEEARLTRDRKAARGTVYGRNTALAMGISAGAIAGVFGMAGFAIAAAGATKKIVDMLGADGSKQLNDSTRFSAATTVAQAQKEQRDIMRSLDMANNPMIQSQQQRLILAKENAANQDASGLGYVATEMAIDFNNFWAWVKSFASSSIGADAITNNGVVY